MAFIQRTSIHGRRLGIPSTGGIAWVSSAGSTVGPDVAAQGWGSGLVQTVSSGGAAVTNSGVTIISTASTSGMAALVLAAPVAGVQKEIYNVSSASALTLETSATTILFLTGATAAAIGSTILTWAAANLFGAGIVLRGLNTTQWAVTSINTDAAIST